VAPYTLHCDSKVWDGIYKVQVSTTFDHVVAVTKAGRLFTWGSGHYGCLGHNNKDVELRPKRVEHGGFVGLFIVCASAGRFRSAAIDSSGLVPTFLLFHYPRFYHSVVYCYLSYGPLDMMQFILCGIWKEEASQVGSTKEARFFFGFVMSFLRRSWLFFLGRCTHGGSTLQQVLALQC
jgi:hypothetical protein